VDASDSTPSENDGHHVADSPGVGKTHLAISLAIAAAQSGRRVYYGTLADLITSLEEAQAAGRLHARLKVLTHPALLVVD
jgi:DNA replication protein DnaC